MMRKLLLSLLTVLLINQQNVPLSVNATNPRILTEPKIEEPSGGKVVCIDLADFFYEIILSVTSFPKQGDCNEQEEAEIATLLQKGINDELRAIPGTIKTKNKVCSDPINNRRRRLQASGIMFPRNWKQRHDETMAATFNNVTTFAAAMTSNQRVAEQDERILLRKRRRAFIYVGGGRCQFCFVDNYDHRALSQIPMMDELSTTTTNKLEENAKKHDQRNLLKVSWVKPQTPYPKVADILLCKKLLRQPLYFYDLGNQYQRVYETKINWINEKNTRLPVRTLRRRRIKIEYWEKLVGPYLPGDTFGVQADMNQAIKLENNNTKQYFKTRGKNDLIQLPVKEGTIRFDLNAFDLPTNVSTGMLLDDPLIVFINGIKLDFKLLMSQPGVKRKTSNLLDQIQGSSFAGIKWKITRWTQHYADNFAYGPEPDRAYNVFITAPLVVFDHKNQFDLDFMIKPNAKARQYGIRHLSVLFHAAQCQVTGVENSPFQDFQSVVESRLFHKLGINLAHEFQGKEGHCLYDKIPVVNVHLVEKKDWRDSKPQCG